jgi:hypothetical protein
MRSNRRRKVPRKSVVSPRVLEDSVNPLLQSDTGIRHLSGFETALRLPDPRLVGQSSDHPTPRETGEAAG